MSDLNDINSNLPEPSLSIEELWGKTLDDNKGLIKESGTGKSSQFAAPDISRYASYGTKTFGKLGYNPDLDNSAIYNANTTGWDDVSRAFKGYSDLAGIGRTDTFGFGAFAIEDSHKPFKQAMDTYGSTREGLAGFTSNTLLSAGYTVGIIQAIALEEAALIATTGGLGVLGTASEITRGVSNISKAWKGWGSSMKFAKDIANARLIKNPLKVGKVIARGLNPLGESMHFVKGFKEIKGLNNWQKGFQGAASLSRDARKIHMTMAESNLEASLVMDEERDRLYEEWYASNQGNDLDMATRNDIEDRSKRAYDITYKANLALIYATNAITFNTMFKSMRMTNKAFGLSASGRMTMREFGSDVIFEATKKNIATAAKKKISNLTFKSVGLWAGRSSMEGVQEIGQDAIAGYAKRYVNGDERLRGQAYNSMLGAIGDMKFESFASGFLMGTFAAPTSFSIKQAQNFVLGGGHEAVTNRAKWKEKRKQDYKSRVKDAEYLTEYFNKTGSWLDVQGDPAFAVTEAQEAMAQAGEDNDRMQFEDKRSEIFRTGMKKVMKNGLEGEMIDYLQGLKKHTPEELNESLKRTDVNEDNIGKFQTKIDAKIKAVKDYKKNYDEAQNEVNPININLLDENDPEFRQKQIAYLVFEDYRDELIFSRDSIRDLAIRLDGMAKIITKGEGISTGELKFLLDKNSLAGEIKSLSAEVRNNKEYDVAVDEIKYKEERLVALKTFQKAFVKFGKLNENSSDRVINEVRESMFESFNGLINSNLRVDDEASQRVVNNKKFDAFWDYVVKSYEHNALQKHANLMLDPDLAVKRMEKSKKAYAELDKNKKDYILKSLNALLKYNVGTAMIQELQEAGYTFDQKELDDLVDNKIMPSNLYNIKTGKDLNATEAKAAQEIIDIHTKRLKGKHVFARDTNYVKQEKSEGDVRKSKWFYRIFSEGKDTPTKISDFIDSLLGSKYINASQVEILNKLKGLDVAKGNVILTESADAPITIEKDGTIRIDVRFSAEDFKNANTPFEYLATSALLQAHFAVQLKKNEKLGKATQSLMETAREAYIVQTKHETTGNVLLFTNPVHFLSESLNNEAFQEFLAGIEDLEDTENIKPQSLWDKFVQLLRDTYGELFEGSLLNRAVNLSQLALTDEEIDITLEDTQSESDKKNQESAKKNSVKEPKSYATAVDEYKKTDLGGGQEGKVKKDAVVKEAQTKEGKAFVDNQVAQMDKNADGTITVYRSGTMQDGHNPATTNRQTAEIIASEREKQGLSSDIVEIKVQPSDISVVIPGVESEVFIKVDQSNKDRIDESSKQEEKTQEQLETERVSVEDELKKVELALKNTNEAIETGTDKKLRLIKANKPKLENKIKNLKWQLEKIDAKLKDRAKKTSKDVESIEREILETKARIKEIEGSNFSIRTFLKGNKEKGILQAKLSRLIKEQKKAKKKEPVKSEIVIPKETIPEVLDADGKEVFGRKTKFYAWPLEVQEEFAFLHLTDGGVRITSVEKGNFEKESDPDAIKDSAGASFQNATEEEPKINKNTKISESYLSRLVEADIPLIEEKIELNSLYHDVISRFNNSRLHSDEAAEEVEEVEEIEEVVIPEKYASFIELTKTAEHLEKIFPGITSVYNDDEIRSTLIYFNDRETDKQLAVAINKIGKDVKEKISLLQGSEVEAKKADIKRRSEGAKLLIDEKELVKVTNQTGTKSTKEGIGKIVTFLNNTFADTYKLIEYDGKDLTLSRNGTEFKISFTGVTLGGGSTRVYDFNINDIIDAKYDAELAALETQPTSEVETITQPTSDVTDSSFAEAVDLDAEYTLTGLKELVPGIAEHLNDEELKSIIENLEDGVTDIEQLNVMVAKINVSEKKKKIKKEERELREQNKAELRELGEGKRFKTLNSKNKEQVSRFTKVDAALYYSQYYDTLNLPNDEFEESYKRFRLQSDMKASTIRQLPLPFVNDKDIYINIWNYIQKLRGEKMLSSIVISRINGKLKDLGTPYRVKNVGKKGKVYFSPVDNKKTLKKNVNDSLETEISDFFTEDLSETSITKDQALYMIYDWLKTHKVHPDLSGEKRTYESKNSKWKRMDSIADDIFNGVISEAALDIIDTKGGTAIVEEFLSRYDSIEEFRKALVDIMNAEEVEETYEEDEIQDALNEYYNSKAFLISQGYFEGKFEDLSKGEQELYRSSVLSLLEVVDEKVTPVEADVISLRSEDISQRVENNSTYKWVKWAKSRITNANVTLQEVIALHRIVSNSGGRLKSKQIKTMMNAIKTTLESNNFSYASIRSGEDLLRIMPVSSEGVVVFQDITNSKNRPAVPFNEALLMIDEVLEDGKEYSKNNIDTDINLEDSRILKQVYSDLFLNLADTVEEVKEMKPEELKASIIEELNRCK